MILLEPGNRILLETCNSMIIREDEEEGKEATAVTSVMTVSMRLPIFEEIAERGGKAALEKHYGDLKVDSDDVNEVILKVNFADIPSDEEKKEELCAKISQMKGRITGGAFEHYFKALNDKAPLTENAEYRIRGDTTLYLVPKDDRVTVIYALDFSEEVDRVVGKVFMDIFAATKTAGAPPCNFMEKPPQELAAFGVTENQGCLGYISFAVLPRHVKDNQREKVIHVLQTFRSFLQYHLKMSKSYWHSKMRARCVSLQKVLNRAKVEDPNDVKKKTTASGKTFRR